MKNNFPIFHIVLAVAVLGLYILHFTSGNQQNTQPHNKEDKKTPAKTETKPLAKNEIKVGYVNIDTLESKYAFFQEIKKDLETKQRLIQSDLRNRQTSFQNEVISFQNSAGTMTMQQIENTKQTLAQKEQELMRYGQNVETEYVKQEQELNKKLNENISSFLKKYADEKGYTMIFGYSKSNKAVGLIQAEESLDITQEVLVGLNDEYKAGKKDTSKADKK